MQNMRPEAVPAKVLSNHAESAHDLLSMCWPISGRLMSVNFCRLDRISAAPAAALLMVSTLTALPGHMQHSSRHHGFSGAMG